MLPVICVVRDSASSCYMRPFYMVSEGMALRSFQDEVNRDADDNMMFRHPEDFELFSLGTFDDSDASFDLHRVPKSLATAKQMKLA